MLSWNILGAQYLNCGPPVQPPFLWSINPSFLFSYSEHLSFVFQKYCRWDIWHFGARSCSCSQQANYIDIKFWLMLCSNCGCQLWMITSAFRNHLLCLCTWRVVSGTRSSTAAPPAMCCPHSCLRLPMRSLVTWICENGVAPLFEVLGAYSYISRIQIFKTLQFWIYPKLDFRGVTKRLWGALTDLDNFQSGHWPPASLWWKFCNLIFPCTVLLHLLFIKLLLKQSALSIWILKFVAGFFSIHHSHLIKLLSSSTGIET